MSFQALLLRWALVVGRSHRVVARLMQQPPRNVQAVHPKHFGPGIDVQANGVPDCPCWTLRPAGTSAPGPHVLFLHGGGYMMEAMPPHRKAIEHWIRHHGLTVTFADYPLAPEHTCVQTLAATLAAYQQLTARYPHDAWTVFGDSAGGGLALALQQQLRQLQAPLMPHRLVLMSPWVDVGMHDPLALQAERFDPLLRVAGMKAIGRLYAGERPVTDPICSPLFGDMNDLGEVLLLAGSHELLLPDCLSLKARLEAAQGNRVEWVLGQGMMHDWIMLPLPEAKRTLDQIAEFVQRAPAGARPDPAA